MAAHDIDRRAGGFRINTLKINTHSFNDMSREEINQYILNMYNNKWLTGDSFYYAITHGIGHNLTYIWMNDDEYIKNSKFLDSKPSEKLPFISRYAQTENAEYLAELFFYYLKGNKLSKDQNQLLDDYLESPSCPFATLS